MPPNANYSDLAVKTLELRGPTIRDNVRNNNAILVLMEEKGQRTAPGGLKILEPLSYRENGNFSFFSGADPIAMSPQDTATAPEFAWKQAAVGVVLTGLEKRSNSGESRVYGKLEEDLKVAESTMANKISESLYSDGTGSGGKQITGLLAAVPVDPTTGTYGNINRADSTNTFWRSQLQGASGYSSTTIQGYFNSLWLKCARGKDHTKLIVGDNLIYAAYEASLQPLQRFTDPKLADLGFTTLKYKGAAVVADGCIGGYCPANSAWFLNPDFIHWRPHEDCNMVPLTPKTRVPFNQDMEGTILGFQGNLTCSGAKFQGFLKGY